METLVATLSQIRTIARLAPFIWSYVRIFLSENWNYELGSRRETAAFVPVLPLLPIPLILSDKLHL